MSVDEALLVAAQQGLAPVTVRFYRWEPPTVSLGYFQEASDVNLEALRSLGIGLVRRPTGGRAVLHNDELTYSIVVPAAALPGGHSIGRSYLAITRALLLGLEVLGVQGQVGKESTSRDNLTRACFALATRADVSAAGAKIIGSAQVRRAGVILQHGSIPLTLDRQLHAAIFGQGEAETAAAGGLAALLGRRPSWEELARAFADGFRRCFGVDLQPGQLSPREQEIARHLMETKYGRPEFTLRPPERGRAATRRAG
ncbi:MAG: lipoate--protein ligase family protein [Armatimonadetes bacterium]|nr:lipoate--protein ligase family protein [Armatimonadota bacterium]